MIIQVFLMMCLMHLMLKILVIIMKKTNPYFDIYDPRICETFDNNSKDILVENWSTREINLNFFSDNLKHFSCAIYSRLNDDEISGQSCWFIANALTKYLVFVVNSVNLLHLVT